MRKFLADLHIHIGTAGNGAAVKITASRRLTFPGIAEEAVKRKGLDLVGIVDCASPPVITDIEQMLSESLLQELPRGGLLYKDELVIIPAVEVESRENNGGRAHYLGYFPRLANIKEFSAILEQYVTNTNLSTQSTGLRADELFQLVDNCGGIFVPAHAFTPHRSFYGSCFDSFREVFNTEQWGAIPAIELGLSADTYLADFLPELKGKTYLSNSDAHSGAKIAREYNQLLLEDLNFTEFQMALAGENGRGILANYGLDPRLGKYHRSYCPQCERNYPRPEPVSICPECGKELVTGVKDRIQTISESEKSVSPPHRPAYIHQVPLLDIPGIGPKTLKKLLDNFGTEMAVLHEVTREDLARVVREKIVRRIIKSREGNIVIESGGGGNYGQVVG